MLNEKYKVSVILLTYNRANFLNKCINSILQQTYKNIELIIIDDGSTDNTAEVVRHFLDDRITYHNFGKIGDIPTLYNLSLKYITGDLIAFIGDDDMWINKKIEKQIAYFDKYDLVCCNAYIIDVNDNIIKSTFFDFKDDFMIDTNLLLRDNVVIASSVIFKKSILPTGKPFQENMYSEDYALWLKLSLDNKLFYLNQKFVLFRLHDDNTSTDPVKSVRLYYNCLEYINNINKISKKRYNISATYGKIRYTKLLIKTFFSLKKYIKCLTELAKLLYLYFLLKYFLFISGNSRDK